MATIAELTQEAAKELGWNADFIAKQWALETGHFTSAVWKADNNPAGIKWYPGMTYGTKGSPANDGGNYAHFDNPVTGYINFVKNNPRYNNVKDSQDVYTEAKTIAEDGWATDPQYAEKICSIIVDGSQTVNFAPPEVQAVHEAPPPAAAAAPVQQAPAYHPDNAFHTIQSGETLSGIANQYRVPLNVLAKYNLIQNPNVIQAGKTLRIPVSYEVRSGDTVSDLARRRNESTSVIGYVNGLANINQIYIGQTLWV